MPREPDDVRNSIVARLLLVEDSPDQARAIQAFLQRAGYAVEVAPSAEVAYEKLRGEIFALVLSDLQLPGESGFDLCRRLKAGEFGSDGLPVILLTRWGDPLNVLRGLVAGADGFISKGQPPGEIVRRVQRVLGRERNSEATRSETSRVVFLNTTFEFTSDREQLLEVLLSGFEDAIHLNKSLEIEVEERRKAEEERAKYAAELERSNAELEQFAQVVSHDLKEPLRMVRSYTSILAKEYGPLLTDAKQSYVSYVTEGTERMRRLIDDLLEYARVGRGQSFADDVDLNAVARTALSNLQVAVSDAKAQVMIEPLPTLRGNALLLTQLVQNLVGNALKFRDARPPVVTISSRESKEQWIISIADNGIGIPQNQRERVFQVFQRLHTRQQYDGTGVGLAICKKIALQHGGDIRIESVVDEGTTFHIAFPKSARRHDEQRSESAMAFCGDRGSTRTLAPAIVN